MFACDYAGWAGDGAAEADGLEHGGAEEGPRGGFGGGGRCEGVKVCNSGVGEGCEDFGVEIGSVVDVEKGGCYCCLEVAQADPDSDYD